MPFKVKAYPFPVLTETGASYNATSKFAANLSLSLYDDQDKFAPKVNYEISLVNANLEKLLTDEEADVVLELFAKETLTRRLLPANLGSGTSDLSNIDLAGTIQVTPLIVSRANEMRRTFSDISSEYGATRHFSVMIGDPLAIAHTVQFEVNMDHSATPDMLTIKRVKGMPDDYYEIATDGNTITLSLSEKMDEIWQIHFKDSSKKPYLYVGLYRQCIEAALADLYQNGVGERQWAKTLATALETRKVKLQTVEDVAVAARTLVFNSGYERIYDNVFAE